MYPQIQNIKKGIIYGCLSALFFALMSVCVKKIGHGLPTSMLIFFRFSIGLSLLLPWIMLREPNFSFKVQQPFRYAIRILMSLLALFCVFYAIQSIPLVNALLLNNTAPLFIPMIVFLLTGAKTSKKAYFGIIIGFIGVAIILHPNKLAFSTGAWIALASGLFAAIAIVQMRLISKTSSSIQMLFWYFLISTFISAIVMSFQWQTPKNWLLLFGMGITGTLYQIFATLSYRHAPVRLVSPLIFLIVVFGGLLDWIIWGHFPTKFTIVGSLLVLIGALLTVYFGQKNTINC